MLKILIPLYFTGESSDLAVGLSHGKQLGEATGLTRAFLSEQIFVFSLKLCHRIFDFHCSEFHVE